MRCAAKSLRTEGPAVNRRIAIEDILADIVLDEERQYPEGCLGMEAIVDPKIHRCR
jgi:hypothetical protein